MSSNSISNRTSDRFVNHEYDGTTQSPITIINQLVIDD